MKTSRSLLSLLVVLLVIAAAALTVSAVFSRRIDKTQRNLLLVEAQHAALLVSPVDIASLSGTAADLSNPLYQRLKNELTAFRAADPQIRFVYLMGYHPELRTQFFYVDSEPTDSSDYSPPGQIFPDTRQEDINHYLSGKPYTDGPYEDSWGEWVSGYVPIRGADGSTIAMIGIDIATDVWHGQISFTRTMITIIAIMAAVIALFIASRIRRKESAINTLAVKNQKLEKTQAGMKQLQTLAHLGAMVIYFPEKMISVDEQFRGAVKGDASGRVSLDAFLEAIHADDREKFSGMLGEIDTSAIVYAWVDVRIGSPTGGYRKYHIYGNIKRHASGAPERFDGIMQDITDIDQ